jgi:hypothetical protein
MATPDSQPDDHHRAADINQRHDAIACNIENFRSGHGKILENRRAQNGLDRHAQNFLIGLDHPIADGHHRLQKHFGFGNSRHNIDDVSAALHQVHAGASKARPSLTKLVACCSISAPKPSADWRSGRLCAALPVAGQRLGGLRISLDGLIGWDAGHAGLLS